jgi:general secretion pathway protein D
MKENLAERNSEKVMTKHHSNGLIRLTAILGLSLCAAAHGFAQTRVGSTGGGGGGGFGGMGGGASASRSSSSGSGGTTTRLYQNSTQIGDAYFTIDPETRRIIYIADETTAKYIAQVLANLDRPKPQVLINCVFIELEYNNASDIGLEGGWGNQGMNGTISSANAVNGFGLSGLSSVVGSNFNVFNQPISSFAATAPLTTPGAGLYSIAGQDYQVTLRAIAQAGKAKILSRPQILARNNQPATILVGQEYPTISSVSYNGLNGTPINAITYKQVGVSLNVTPFITADNCVEMIVQPEVSQVDATTSVPISPGINAQAIDTRSADTVVVTSDGQTVIVGGLIQDSKSTTDTKIPLLGDIPLLGNLFKRHQKNDSKSELIIFLTPHIIQNPTELAALSAREREKSDATKGLTEKELNKYLDTLPVKAPDAGVDPKPPRK